MLTRPRLRLLAGIVAGLVVLACASTAQAAPGELDPSFGDAGVVRLLQSEEKVSVKGIAVQPDDKIVLAGAEDPGNLLLFRLLPNGDPDLSFGVAGKVVMTLAGGFSEARAVTIQPDGKIVVVGSAKGAADSDFLIARFTVSGSPDPGFGGGDGVVILPVGPGEDRAESVTVGADGRIAAAGRAEVAKENQMGVAVLRGDGTPESTFAGDGTTVIKTPTGDDTGEAIALRPDNRVLLADENGAGAGAGFSLVQLLPGGTPDPSFGGGDGITLDPAPGTASPSGRNTDLALLGDGRIVATGYGYDEVGSPPNTESKIAAARYLPDGELDSSFGEGGFFTLQIPGEATAGAIEVGEGGRLLLAGEYSVPVTDEQAPVVVRLAPGGTLDPAFGTGGVVLRPQTASFGEVFESAALDSQDRLVDVGTAFLGGGMTTHAVSRYLGDPRPPTENRAPHTRMKKVPKKVAVGKLAGFSGTASDPDGEAVQSVQIALVKLVRGGARASRHEKPRCLVLKNGKAKFKPVRVAKGAVCPQRWLPADGTRKWTFGLEEDAARQGAMSSTRVPPTSAAWPSPDSEEARQPLRVPRPARENEAALRMATKPKVTGSKSVGRARLRVMR